MEKETIEDIEEDACRVKKSYGVIFGILDDSNVRGKINYKIFEYGIVYWDHNQTESILCCR